MATRRALTYVDGIGAGIAAVAIAVAFWLAHASRGLRAMYRDIGDLELSAITRVATHPAWMYGVPVALAAAFVLAHQRRPKHALVGLAALAVVVDAGWYYAAWAPVFELSRNIH